MVINLSPELEAELNELAKQQGVSPEEMATKALKEKIQRSLIPAPRDEWERRLHAMGKNYGVSLTNENLSREEMYE